MPIKIVYDSEPCIGAGDCAKVSPDWFKVVNKKAVLIGGKSVGGTKFELIVDDSLQARAVETKQVCPVSCIKPFKI